MDWEFHRLVRRRKRLTSTTNSIIYDASLSGAWDGPSDPPPEFITGELTVNKGIVTSRGRLRFCLFRKRSGDLIDYVWNNNSVGKLEYDVECGFGGGLAISEHLRG
jgi:hypothetical protein